MRTVVALVALARLAMVTSFRMSAQRTSPSENLQLDYLWFNQPTVDGCTARAYDGYQILTIYHWLMGDRLPPPAQKNSELG